jgi:hypothetical protein
MLNIMNARFENSNSVLYRPGYCFSRHVYCPIRNAIVMFVLAPALAFGGDTVDSNPVNDFYITVTNNGLYLCGEGFGGIYGCIDEAVSREAKSVVVSASSDASAQEVQDLLNAVHAIGFDQVGVVTLDESDT